MKYKMPYGEQAFTFFLFLVAMAGSVVAQTALPTTGDVAKEVNYRTTSGSSVIISGTSTLHNWTMKSDEGSSTASFSVSEDQKITQVNSLLFSVRAESILSEYALMNNKTYEALKTKSYPNISYVTSTTTGVTSAGDNSFLVNSRGKLTIAGVSRDVEMNVTCQLNPVDRSITCIGCKKIKMTDYGIKPPTVMLNTVKTGNDITIDFIVKLNRQ